MDGNIYGKILQYEPGITHHLIVVGILGRVIHVYGDFLPRHLFGKRFTALCATIRMVFLALCFLFFHHFLWTKKKVEATSKSYHYDVVIVDGVSTPLVLLKYIGHCKILFYCHFPDKVRLLFFVE